MKEKSSLKKVKMPQTREDASVLISQIDKLDRAIDSEAIILAKKISLLKKRSQSIIEKWQKMIEERRDAIRFFAEKNREELTTRSDGKIVKTIEDPAGEYGWKISDLVLDFAKQSEKMLVSKLENAGLGKYVRILKEVDKNAIKKAVREDPKKLEQLQKIAPQISINKPEYFFVEPAGRKMKDFFKVAVRKVSGTFQKTS